jgi:hypothetical protein
LRVGVSIVVSEPQGQGKEQALRPRQGVTPPRGRLC